MTSGDYSFLELSHCVMKALLTDIYNAESGLRSKKRMTVFWTKMTFFCDSSI